MIATNLHLILHGLDIPCFSLPGMSQTPEKTLYLCGFNAKGAPYTYFFPLDIALH